MSGGRFNYKDCELKNEIFGYTYGERITIPNVFEDREISELVYDVLNLIHEFDWYESGDTDESDYLDAKQRFKSKWFGATKSERVRRVIEQQINEYKDEMYKTFEIERK